MEKKALGRGLDALLPAAKPVSMPELPEVQHLLVDSIFQIGTNRDKHFPHKNWQSSRRR